jgi:hypothetical protein
MDGDWYGSSTSWNPVTAILNDILLVVRWFAEDQVVSAGMRSRENWEPMTSQWLTEMDSCIILVLGSSL